MSTGETERRVRALAAAADLPRHVDLWPGVAERLPRVRRRRTMMRAAVAAAAALAAAAAIAIPVSLSGPASAAALARRATAAARTGAGLPPFQLTEVTTNNPVGFQPEPPPPKVTDYISYASPEHWREVSVVTEPFGEGTQAITRVRNGPLIATVTGGRTLITHVHGQAMSPFAAPPIGSSAALRKLLAAGGSGSCAPHVSVTRDGPRIDGQATLVLHVGPSPCPSADVPQANGPATYWLDAKTLLLLRAVLHASGGRLAETIEVTSLRYHPKFPAATFRLPSPGSSPTHCSAVTSLPDLAALRKALAYPPLLPASLPDGLHTGAIGSTGTATGRCKITDFVITYLGASGKPAVQLTEAPSSSPFVRFPGRTVTIRPGLTGTLNRGSGRWAILWWIQDSRYLALQSGGTTAGVRLTGVSDAVLLHIAASLRS